MKQTTLGDGQRPRTHLFMVRVWQEDLGEGKTEWRGQVRHVISGEVRYFRDWATLVEHLKAMLPGIAEADSGCAQLAQYRDAA